jgi:hypothetical protein
MGKIKINRSIKYEERGTEYIDTVDRYRLHQ